MSPPSGREVSCPLLNPEKSRVSGHCPAALILGVGRSGRADTVGEELQKVPEKARLTENGDTCPEAYLACFCSSFTRAGAGEGRRSELPSAGTWGNHERSKGKQA